MGTSASPSAFARDSSPGGAAPGTIPFADPKAPRRPAPAVPDKGWREVVAWVVPLIVYLAVVIPTAYAQREVLSPDAVSYIRRGLYVATGEFAASVSGYWSPMLSWSIAPFILMGIDPAYAARVALCVWGAAFLLTVGLFIRAFTPMTWLWRAGALSVLAVVVVDRVAGQITPDLLLATWLFAYFAAVTSPRFAASAKWRFLTGLLGGLAFLGKSYALPFLAVHLPATIVVHLLARWRELPPDQRRVGPLARRGLSMFLPTAAGILLVAGPWVAVLSMKYGRLTTNTSGAVARSIVRPEGTAVDPEAGANNMLRWSTPPPDPYVAHIENPDVAEYPKWSPFDSRRAFEHQVWLVKDHARKALYFIKNFDVAWVGASALILSGFLLLLRTMPAGLERWRLAWLLGTAALYCSGFLLVWLIPRYIDSLVLPLVLILSLWVLHVLPLARTFFLGAVMKFLAAAGVLAAFTVPALLDVRELNQPHTFGIYREVAGLIRQQGLTGPIAVSHRHAGMYLSLYTGFKMQALYPLNPLDPRQPHHREAEQALLRGNPGTVVIWYDRRTETPQYAATRTFARGLVLRLGWERKFRINRSGRQIEVYGPPPGQKPTVEAALRAIVVPLPATRAATTGPSATAAPASP